MKQKPSIAWNGDHLQEVMRIKSKKKNTIEERNFYKYFCCSLCHVYWKNCSSDAEVKTLEAVRSGLTSVMWSWHLMYLCGIKTNLAGWSEKILKILFMSDHPSYNLATVKFNGNIPQVEKRFQDPSQYANQVLVVERKTSAHFLCYRREPKHSRWYKI